MMLKVLSDGPHHASPITSCHAHESAFPCLGWKPREFDVIDFNDVSAKFAAEITLGIFEKSIRKIAQSATVSAPIVQANLAEYSKNNAEQYAYVRTIVCDSPSYLPNIYQPATFVCGKEVFNEEQFVSYLNTFKRAAIRGHAGAGKSLFLRKHFLRIIELKQSIPILFDLRSLNNNFSGVMERLHRHARSMMPWMEFEIFRSLLRSGKIELLLDGLDEVSHSIRPSVNSDIGVITKEFPKTKVIVTTRFGDRYATPGNVAEFNVQPFSKTQAAALVRSLDFPEKNKVKFADALESYLYDRSPDLLSNPLLCSIMLLTYKRFADVPPQLHLYYQQAYEVLFSRHDASKDEGFKRDFLSPLNVAEMQSVLSYFSAITYASDMFEFSETECLEKLKESAAANSLDARAEDIKEDLIEAVSLIMRDGVELKFVHRSFQEYFTACYISKSGQEISRACIDAVKTRDDTDSVIPMSIALNESHFFESWLIPTLRDELKDLEDDYGAGRFMAVVRHTLPIVRVSREAISIGTGISGRSKSFNIFLRTVGQGSQVGLYEKKDLLLAEDGPSVSDRFKNMASEIPVPDWFKSLMKDSEFEFNTGDRNLSTLSELPIWKPMAERILAAARQWLRLVEARKRSQEASPLEAFKRAASIGARQLEGDRTGPLIKRKRGNETEFEEFIE